MSEPGRDALIRSVVGRVDSAGDDGAAAAHDPAAAREAEELLMRHLATPDGTDPEVQYTVGVLYLLRAVTPRADEAAPANDSGEPVVALTLLAPLYQNPPGMPDVLPPGIRSMLDSIPGFGPPPADPAERVHAHAAAQNDLGMLLIRLRMSGGQPVHARAAGAVLCTASGRVARGSPARAMALCNLGYALMLGESRPEEITEAVTVLRESFAQTPSGDPNYARCAYGLGLALVAASSVARDREMLAEATGMLRLAVRSAPDGTANLPQMLSDLGFALTSHVSSAGRGAAGDPGLTGDPGLAAEAAEAVEVLTRAAGLLPAGAPQRPQVLLRFADALLAADRPGEATELLVGNEALFPPGSEQFEAAGQVMFRAAMRQASLERGSDPGRQATRDLEKRLSDPAMKDVKNALDSMMGLIGLGGGGDRSKDAGLMKFATELLGTDTDDPYQVLNLVVKAQNVLDQRFADLPAGEREQARHEYPASLREEDARPTDLFVPLDPAETATVDELTVLCERLLPELDPASREHAMITMSACNLTMIKTARAPDAFAPGRAEAMLRNLNELMQMLPRLGVPSTDLFGASVAFSHLLVSPFEMLARAGESVRQMRRRVAGLVPGTPEYDDARGVLAIRLFSMGGLTDDEAAVDEARAIARDLVATAWPPSAALISTWCFRETMRLGPPASIADPEEAAAAGVADSAAGSGQSRHFLARHASREAARSLALRDATGALETLEDGRAWMLSNAINTRGDLDTLRAADAEAYGRLLAIKEEITRIWDDTMLSGRLPTEEGSTEGFRLKQEGARLVAELSESPGFDRFLMPVRLGVADLRPAAADGPVITINVHPRRCDALIVTRDGDRPVVVPLPGLSASDLAEQAEGFRTAVAELAAGRGSRVAPAAGRVFGDVLGWLWDVLAEPVLDALEIGQQPLPGMPWPRVWWSPTGLLNVFPLHAAGRHDQPGASVLDRVVSSYTPTIRALLRSRAHAARAVDARARAGQREREVLAVAMPETAGHASLEWAAAEAEALAIDSTHRLIGRKATRVAVLAALPGAGVTHFACHASSDPHDPTASHLLLHDGALNLGDIAGLRLDGAELAYLSACGTSRGSTRLADETLHLASAFQLAGYSQSVATVWEVGDAFAARAAAEFYQRIAPALLAGGPLPAAAALHATVRALRDSHRAEPWAWSALVHAGA